jgi:hypothetical protein
MASILETNKQEMHDLKCILVAWYTFDRRRKNSNVFLPFHLKPFADILLITN